MLMVKYSGIMEIENLLMESEEFLLTLTILFMEEMFTLTTMRTGWFSQDSGLEELILGL